MFLLRLCLLIFLLKYACSNWVSEWLTPLQYHYSSSIGRTNDIRDLEESTGLTPNIEESENTLLVGNDVSTSSHFETTLETTVKKAKDFINTLKKEISRVSQFELGLKDIIANGSLGVTVVKVSTIDQPPRSYLVSESVWTVCSGEITFPADYPPTNWRSVPKCDDDEISVSVAGFDETRPAKAPASAQVKTREGSLFPHTYSTSGMNNRYNRLEIRALFDQRYDCTNL